MTALKTIRKRLDAAAKLIADEAAEATKHAVGTGYSDIAYDLIIESCDEIISKVVDEAQEATWDIISDRDGKLTIRLSIFPGEDAGYLDLHLESWIDDPYYKESEPEQLQKLLEVLEAFIPRLRRKIAEPS